MYIYVMVSGKTTGWMTAAKAGTTGVSEEKAKYWNMRWATTAGDRGNIIWHRVPTAAQQMPNGQGRYRHRWIAGVGGLLMHEIPRW